MSLEISAQNVIHHEFSSYYPISFLCYTHRMIWAADEPGEEPAVDCGDTNLQHDTETDGHGGGAYHKELLGQEGVKVLNSHHVKVHREPGEGGRDGSRN